MDWNDDLVDRLAAGVPGGYQLDGEATTEPTALAGLALAARRRADAARKAADWLAELQADSGSVGVSPSRLTPCWPTSLAILLWQAVQTANGNGAYAASIDRAVEWAMQERGLTHERGPFAGHDTTLTGWSWAANCHSWLEPTAMFVLALRAVGQGQHARTREAVRLLVDRLLATGGCNYGNTIVLGQQILPHVEPTGLVLMTLAGEKIADPRIELSLQYLERELSADATTASLSYGLMGLAAHGRKPMEHATWLEQAYERTLGREPSTYKLALLALAMLDGFPFRAA